jgi:hypothetical protein
LAQIQKALRGLNAGVYLAFLWHTVLAQSSDIEKYGADMSVCFFYSQTQYLHLSTSAQVFAVI